MSETPELTKAVAVNPTQSEFETMQRQCKMAVMSQMLPDIYSQGNANTQLAKACVVAMKGRELGIPMMQAFSQINVIKGKPTVSAELMLALIYRAHPKAEINFTTLTNEACVIKAKRPGSSEFTTLSFTMKDAQQAGLAGGANWKKYPRAMLRSRAVSEMARTLFPDAIMGCSYTPEELGAEVNIDGETVAEPDAVPNDVIEVEAQPPASEPIPEPQEAVNPNTGEIIDADFDHSDYVIQVGKNKGTPLKAESKEYWANWAINIRGWAAENKKEINGKLLEDLETAEAYASTPEDAVDDLDRALGSDTRDIPNYAPGMQ